MLHADTGVVAEVGSMFSSFFVLEHDPMYLLRGLRRPSFFEFGIPLIAEWHIAMEVFSFCGVITRLGCS